MHESGFKSSLSPPEDTPVCTKENCELIREEIAHTKENKEMSYGNNSPLIRLQGAERWLAEPPGNGDEQRASNREGAKVYNGGSAESQPVELNGASQATQDIADTPPLICSEDFTGGMHGAKNLEVEVRKIGRRKRVPDWSKDGGDKFYSLTEDSEATSSSCNQSATDGSISSESESASSVAESTVRQRRWQRRCSKARARLTGGAELSGQSTKTLKWDYLGTRLAGLGKVPAADSLPNADGSMDCQAPSTSATSTDSEMLQIIYDSIKELQTETRVESRWARITTKHLQGAVPKVAKSCTEIKENLNTIEDRTTAVEVDVEALREQLETHRGQLTDIMWNLEDQENWQRRNNLRVLGIEEGAIFEKARPDAPRHVDNVTFFTRPDYCHITVERRWRLRQLIKPFQDIGGEAYLLALARLKTVVNGKVKLFTSEIQAKEYLMELKAL
ncbi:hypothetical protein NDU88_012075 [Pleurodeles waltl]|uniref:Uncharacterized protein n=1 Tax=Pleurodeles waltl TaxID=8319 RepID=A0AAV7QZ42_PLEWA|nr:hypothetical protein NDU88_012075 [Pleurodeles waltl]